MSSSAHSTVLVEESGTSRFALYLIENESELKNDGRYRRLKYFSFPYSLRAGVSSENAGKDLLIKVDPLDRAIRSSENPSGSSNFDGEFLRADFYSDLIQVDLLVNRQVLSDYVRRLLAFDEDASIILPKTNSLRMGKAKLSRISLDKVIERLENVYKAASERDRDRYFTFKFRSKRVIPQYLQESALDGLFEYRIERVVQNLRQVKFDVELPSYSEWGDSFDQRQMVFYEAYAEMDQHLIPHLMKTSSRYREWVSRKTNYSWRADHLKKFFGVYFSGQSGCEVSRYFAKRQENPQASLSLSETIWDEGDRLIPLLLEREVR